MKTFYKVLKVSFMTVLVVILLLLLLLFVAFNMGGYEAIQITGDDMSPEIVNGDVIIIRPTSVNDVEVGDIITFRDGFTRITHQVVAKSDGKLTTKATNKDSIDVIKVTGVNLQGKMLTKLNDGKGFILFITNPVNMIILLLIVLVLIAIPVIMRFSKSEEVVKSK